jgi:hypothetical protein
MGESRKQRAESRKQKAEGKKQKTKPRSGLGLAPLKSAFGFLLSGL